MAAFEAIGANKAAGCVVDAATYHCIRRLELEDAVVGVRKIGITQATSNLYQARFQSLALEKGSAGTMGHRGGKFYLTERTQEEKDRTRATISSDIEWLANNAEILPARPVEDPPPAFRRLGSVNGAHFFDDVYAANGSHRMLVVDDLFTRQVAGMLGTPGTSLQPVLMIARNRRVLSARSNTRRRSRILRISGRSSSRSIPLPWRWPESWFHGTAEKKASGAASWPPPRCLAEREPTRPHIVQ